MGYLDYLGYLVNQIHHAVVATVDDEGLPLTSAIDMMDADEEGLYFLAAKGKGFYSSLKKRGYLSLTAMKGENTLSGVAISLRGKVRELGYDKIPSLFEKNPYMYGIYPNEESMHALTVFQIYEGNGEWFDLSKKPIERASFSFGGAKAKDEGYFINGNCIGCGACLKACPQGCIITERTPFVIEAEHCLHCGNCMQLCPFKAVERR